MAEVRCGSFSIIDNRVCFTPAKNDTSDACKRFERATKQLNDDFNRFIEGNFELVGVCANRTIVFVALNFEIPRMGLVYEMKIKGGTSFENDIATEMLKPSSDKRMNWYKEEFQIKSIRSSGDENAVMLRTDNTNMGCVYFKIKNEWRRCPVTSLGREQNILEITCDQNHCTALTDTGQTFMCEWPTTGVSPLWQPKGNKSHLRTDVDFNNWYKTVGTPMSSNFGMTGTFGNPYLLNMNTDGEYTDKITELYKLKHDKLDTQHKSTVESHKKALEAARGAYVMDKLRHNTQEKKDLLEVQALETELETRQAHHSENMRKFEEAAQKLREAEAAHRELAHQVKTHTEHMNNIKARLEEKHASITGGSRVSRETKRDDSSPVHSMSVGATNGTNPRDGSQKRSIMGALTGRWTRKV
ncbi:MAG: hypothetical protein EBR09_16320 [Proteobacteria bacterium]|nr:hypothetical protein [Pseudomonadota bacterium]